MTEVAQLNMDLLNALKNLLFRVQLNGGLPGEEIYIAEAEDAIAKAEGNS